MFCLIQRLWKLPQELQHIPGKRLYPRTSLEQLLIVALVLSIQLFFLVTCSLEKKRSIVSSQVKLKGTHRFLENLFLQCLIATDWLSWLKWTVFLWLQEIFLEIWKGRFSPLQLGLLALWQHVPLMNGCQNFPSLSDQASQMQFAGIHSILGLVRNLTLKHSLEPFWSHLVPWNFCLQQLFGLEGLSIISLAGLWCLIHRNISD